MDFSWDVEYFQTRQGDTIAYRAVIPDNATQLVVWVHAISHCSNIYRLVAKQFASFRSGIAMLDMRGHGKTPGKKGDLRRVGQLEEDVHEFIALLRQKHRNLPVFLMGHSAGCLPVLRYVARYQDEHALAGTALIVPAIDMNPFEMEYSVYDRKGSTFYYRLKYARRKPNIEAFPEKYRKSFEFKVNFFVLLFSGLFPPLRHAYLTTNEPEPMYAVEDQSPRTTYNFAKGLSVGDCHAKAFEFMNIPTLLVAAENDEVIDPKALEVIYNWHLPSNIPRSFFVQPKASHIDIVYRIVHKLVKWMHVEMNNKNALVESLQGMEGDKLAAASMPMSSVASL